MQWSEIIDVEQNSDAWHEARRGIPTASEFSTLLMQGRGGASSKTRRTYMLKLIGERLTGESADTVQTQAMQRGHEMEPEAADLYAMMYEAPVESVGFIRNHHYDCGASPDRLVGEDGLLEIKTKVPHLQLDLLLAHEVPDEHADQIQGQIWLAEREWCDFVSYWPGLPLFVKRVYRDEEHIQRLRQAVEQFFDELLSLESRIRSQYTV